jgi:hypothetical protein
MSMDDRLEKIGAIHLKAREALKERHVALAQSVELMKAAHSHRLGLITHNFEVVLDSIKRLENIAGSRQRRSEDPNDSY